MRVIFSLVSLLFFAVVIFANDWQSDILDDGYEMRYVNMPEDYSGKVRSTIIRKKSDCGSKRAVLYIHGYNDYFFQKEMGDRFVDSCYNFYAVDLRKYGRSIMEGQKKFQARDLHEYFADIDSALAQIHSDGINDINLIGHSTGGLITSLYMNESNDSTIKSLILNSPFLEWNLNGFLRKIAVPTVGAISKLFPTLSISQGNHPGYGKSLLKQYHGEWNYNTDWKLLHSQNVEASWIRAISNAQNQLKKHGDVKVPILLMHSSGSVHDKNWTPAYQSNDAVLNVEDISKIGKELGRQVEEQTIEDGMHDLILSAPEVREKVYQTIFNFLRN